MSDLHEELLAMADRLELSLCRFMLRCASDRKIPQQEARLMAGIRCTDVQSRLTEFLDLTSLTLDAFEQLVQPFEDAFKPA